MSNKPIESLLLNFYIKDLFFIILTQFYYRILEHKNYKIHFLLNCLKILKIEVITKIMFLL